MTHQREAVERADRLIAHLEKHGYNEQTSINETFGFNAGHLRILLNLAKQTTEEPTEAMIEAGLQTLDRLMRENQHRRVTAQEQIRDIYLAMRSQQSGNSHE